MEASTMTRIFIHTSKRRPGWMDRQRDGVPRLSRVRGL
jgi:hypothetical protein